MMVDELPFLKSDTLTEDDGSGPSGTQGKGKKNDFLSLTLAMMRSQQMMWKVRLLNILRMQKPLNV